MRVYRLYEIRRYFANYYNFSFAFNTIVIIFILIFPLIIAGFTDGNKLYKLRLISN